MSYVWTKRAFEKNWQSITSSSDGTKLAACINGGYIWTSQPNQASATGYISNGTDLNDIFAKI